MSFETDMIIDRRRLKRRLTFWRIVGVLAVVAAVLTALAPFDLSVNKDRIARLEVDGIIVDDRLREEALADIAEDDKVKALIIAINSPGGTFTGGDSLYQSLRKVAEKKPVVTVMGGTAASAGYMIAIAADYVIASAGTITGSIGVIMQTADVTGLMDKIGIKPVVVKSGHLKAQPNPMEPFSEAARRVTEGIIGDFYDMFVEIVIERRNLPKSTAYELADGRIYSGRQAAANGLIDAIGRESDAIKWLAANHNVDDQLPVIDIKIDYEDEPWRELVGKSLGKALFSERLRLDGVLSLWHPEGYLD
ncbi:MAG: signal peptide peptidase SppA [Rhodospirillales bacterium]|nr:signal peptide peptidase SppA [Rhodospirillales bacterium]